MSKQLHRLSFVELSSPDLPNWLIIGKKPDSKIELISALPRLSGYQLGKPCRFCGRSRTKAQRGVLEKEYSQGIVSSRKRTFKSNACLRLLKDCRVLNGALCRRINRKKNQCLCLYF